MRRNSPKDMDDLDKLLTIRVPGMNDSFEFGLLCEAVMLNRAKLMYHLIKAKNHTHPDLTICLPKKDKFFLVMVVLSVTACVLAVLFNSLVIHLYRVKKHLRTQGNFYILLLV